MSQSIAEELIKSLAEAGVRRIYGIVGDSLNPVTDAIRRNGKIQWVHVRHEETAAFAAGAEAQLTGQLAVCAGSCGPGNLHLINGLFDAHRSMAPVLAIAAHIPSSEIGTDYFQETHPDQLFRECSHYCELVSNPRQMPRVLQTAMQHAVGKQGVAVIVLSGDVAAMEMPSETFAHGLVTAQPVIRPADADLGRLADLLNQAGRVTLFCGSGCAGAHDDVVALAENSQGAGRLCLPRQGMGRIRQPLRRRHDRTAGLGRRVQGHARVRPLALARHGFSLRHVHAVEPAGRPDRHPRRAPGPAIEARPGPLRRRARYHSGAVAAPGAEIRSRVPGRHARTPGRGPAEAPRLCGTRRHAAADPPGVRRRHARRTGGEGRGLQHGHRHVYRLGRAAIFTPPRVGGSSVHSITARWPTPCPRRSARRPRIPAAK